MLVAVGENQKREQGAEDVEEVIGSVVVFQNPLGEGFGYNAGEPLASQYLLSK